MLAIQWAAQDDQVCARPGCNHGKPPHLAHVNIEVMDGQRPYPLLFELLSVLQRYQDSARSVFVQSASSQGLRPGRLKRLASLATGTGAWLRMAGRRIEELSQDRTRDRVRADMATVQAGASAGKTPSNRTFLYLVPQLAGANQPDGILIKKNDYSYFAIGVKGPKADSSAFEMPLLRYMRPGEVGVLRISERTLLSDDKGLGDTTRDLYVELAEASDLALSQVRFVVLHSFAAPHRRAAATKDVMNQRRFLARCGSVGRASGVGAADAQPPPTR